ncbi:hypothetical protein F4780DRAFT_740510 [Xylariomycetidae sp. FL0641]|nr:hypothetical protein F4780DRAFT_740510 [Xylariomycetidae sp. FL0641]
MSRSEAIAKLKHFVTVQTPDGGGRGPQFIFLVGSPMAAKSTQVIPEIWRTARDARSANLIGIYIQRHRVELTSLQHHADNHGGYAIVTDDLWTKDNYGRLGLTVYDEFLKMTQAPLPSDPSNASSNTPLLVFLDVEAQPTIYGETIFGIIVQWASNLPVQRDVRIVLVAPRYRSDINITLQTFLQTRASWVGLPAVVTKPHRNILDHDDEIPGHHFIRYLATYEAPPSKQDTPGPAVVLIGFPLLVKPKLTGYIDRHLNWKKPNIYEFDIHTTMDQVFGFLADPKPKIIIVNPSCGISFPIPNVQAVVSHDSTLGAVFYPPMAHFTTKLSGFTQSQRDLATAWAFKCNVQLHTLECTHLDTPSDTDNLLGQLEVFCLNTAHYFSSLDVSSAPLPALRGIHQTHPHLLRRVWRRLQLAKCCRYHPDMKTVGPTPLGKAMLRYFDRQDLCPSHNARLALLLAHIEHDDLSVFAKRVLIRLAAMCDTPLFQKTELLEKEIRSMGTRVLSFIEPHCAGEGKTQIHFGDLWVSLGLWLQWKRDGYLTATSNPPWTFLAEGRIRISFGALDRVDQYVTRLENYLGIPPCQDEIEDTGLSVPDRDAVHEVMVRSYLHNVLVSDCDEPDEDQAYLHAGSGLPLESFQLHPLVDLKIGAAGNTERGRLAYFTWSTINQDGCPPAPGNLQLIANRLLCRIQEESIYPDVARLLRAD